MAGYTINLNDPKNFTLGSVRYLIALGDNEKHNQLQVTTAGLASFVSWSADEDKPRQSASDIAFTLEIYSAGSDHVGQEAAQDDVWTKAVFDDLSSNWPNPSDPSVALF